ncbi:unnamed protein product [Chironomus riparius]|uniref:Uncharacterized protein n=1 Tax=Chironomus riparius TaxID=315576 RepID=A0A9N9WXN5_9DIPT|nr:unnamed protein product [Chironomus riparius]
MEQSESIVLKFGKIVGLVNCFLSIVAFFHIVILLAYEANEIFTEPAWFIFEIHFVLMFSTLWGLLSFWFYSVILNKQMHKGVWFFIVIPLIVLMFVAMKLYFRTMEMIINERFYFRLPFFVYWMIFLFEIVSLFVILLVGFELKNPKIIVTCENLE